jgi:hypothetical protein
VRLLGDRGIGLSAFEFELATGQVDQPSDHTQERGFAGAIASSYHQGFAAGQAEIEARKDLAPAPAAREIIASELHQARFSLPIAGGKAVSAADNPDMPRIFTEVPSLMWRPAQKDLISPPL